MNKLYKKIASLAGVSALTIGLGFAQVELNAPGVTILPDGSGPEDQITMTIDISKICMPAGKELDGLSEIGFHSGYINAADTTGWNSAVEFDSPDAITFTETAAGSGIYEATFTPATYYGVAVADMLGFSFVVNAGPNGGGWDKEGKAFDDAGDCADFFVFLPFDNSTSVNEVKAFSEFKIYPNPASTMATVSYTATEAGNQTIELFNTVGQRVSFESINNVSAGAFQYNLNLSNLSSGLYFVTVSNANSKTTSKLTIK